MTRQAAAGGAFRRSRATLVLRLLFACCLASSLGLAQGEEPQGGEVQAPARTTPEVRVDCPELTPEQVAAIEARQMGELLSQQARGVTLLLVCSHDRVSGIWQEGGVTVESRFLSRNTSDSAVELLHWLASVLLELRKQRQEPAPIGGATAAVTGASVAIQTPPANEAELKVAPAPPPAPVSPEPADEPTPSTTAPSVDRSAREPSPWTLALGASYAHFGTEIVGALGPQAAVSYRAQSRLELRAMADVRIGLRSSRGFGMFDVGFSVGVSYDVLPSLSLALAPRLVLTTFTAPQDTTGSSAPVVAGGAVLLARGRLPFRALRPFLDLGVEALTPTREATLEGETVLTVPHWQGLVTIGAELPL